MGKDEKDWVRSVLYCMAVTTLDSTSEAFL